jgi:hypothetical protein
MDLYDRIEKRRLREMLENPQVSIIPGNGQSFVVKINDKTYSVEAQRDSYPGNEFAIYRQSENDNGKIGYASDKNGAIDFCKKDALGTRERNAFDKRYDPPADLGVPDA